MSDLCVEKDKELISVCDCGVLAQGYKEMSHINLGLAEEGVALDNEALELCEQKFAECE